MRLDEVKAFVLDVDGTLVHRAGDEVHVQPGAVEVLARIRASGRPLAIFTNGSHESPAWFAAGPARRRARHRRRRDAHAAAQRPGVPADAPAEGPVLPFATEPAREFMLERGHARSPAHDGPVDAVFVAHADTVDFELLERAARAVIAGARLLTASYAPGLRRRERPDPQPRRDDHGRDRQGVEHAAGDRRQAVAARRWRTVEERLGVPAHELAVIGDDLTMDVRLGRMGGARTVLVASGITGAVDLDTVPERTARTR